MGVGAGLYMYDVVVKSSRSLFHLLMISSLSLSADPSPDPQWIRVHIKSGSWPTDVSNT